MAEFPPGSFGYPPLGGGRDRLRRRGAGDGDEGGKGGSVGTVRALEGDDDVERVANAGTISGGTRISASARKLKDAVVIVVEEVGKEDGEDSCAAASDAAEYSS